MHAAVYPKSLVQNPRKFDEFKRAYEPGALIVAAVALALITGLCQLASWWLDGAVTHDGMLGLLLPWALLGVSLVLMALTGRLLAAGQRRVPWTLWLQSTLQIWWIGSVIWYAASPVALFMFFVLSIAAINDARYLYDTADAHLSHLLPWLAFPGMLLLVDAFGGPGLLARYAESPGYVKHAVAVTVGVNLLIQFVLSVVGKQCYETDAALWSRSKLEAQLAEDAREREVLRRSCDLMAHGVSASSFSHDVASPLSLISMSAEEIVELVENHALERSDGQARLRAAAGQLRRATSRVMEMTGALARSLRQAEEPAATDVRELVDEAVAAATLALERYGFANAPPARVELAPADVFVVSGHAGAIANVIVNGVLQLPAEPVEIRGSISDDWYYRLDIRDFGVEPDQRAAALAAVSASLSISAPEGGAAHEPRPKHYGIALMLAKLLVVRHGGWIEAASPGAGRGLVFSLLLPRHSPAQIPAAAHPAPADARERRVLPGAASLEGAAS